MRDGVFLPGGRGQERGSFVTGWERPVLSAVEKIGRIPDYYFQAVGSGTLGLLPLGRQINVLLLTGVSVRI